MKQTVIIFLVLCFAIFGFWLLEPLLGDDVINEKPIVQVADREHEQIDKEPVVTQGNVSREVKPRTERDLPDIKYIDTTNTRTTVETSNQVVETTPPAPTVPVIVEPELISGSFVGSGSYRASGSVYISGSDLSLVNLDSTNVPDGRVYLSNGTNASDFIDLGRLKGNKGDQNYKIPSGIDASEYTHVLIWCRAFSSLVGSANI